jgi:hypothetical protein
MVTKFKPFCDAKFAGQYDSEVVAADIAYSSHQFVYFDRSKADAEIATLKAIGNTDPNQKTEVDYAYAEASTMGSSNVDDIVNDWNNADSRFLKLLSDSRKTKLEIEVFNAAHILCSNEALMLCSRLKILCDAGRPWQFSPSSSVTTLTGSDIVARWDNNRYGGTICQLPRHPSYPAAHGGIAFADALLIKKTFPKDTTLHASAMKIAQEIGERRIIAGVHFPRDIDAARQLITTTFRP